MSFQTGDVIGDYEIVGELGRDAYRVRNVTTYSHDAMKVFTTGAPAGDLADGLMRELRVYAGLDHPNIASFRTALRVENMVVMVTELVEGVSLEERLRQGPLSSAETMACGDRVLSALAYAHARGVIHRDVKPANLILTPAGDVKITGFRIAHSAADSRLTATGMAARSLLYLCPEQVQLRPADARSDIYSLGLTLYETVVGRHPIQGAREYEILTAHLKQIPVTPASVNPDIPWALSSAIMRALEKDPARRFQSADDFRRALGGSLG